MPASQLWIRFRRSHRMILGLVRRRCCGRQSRVTSNRLCRPLTVFPKPVHPNLFESQLRIIIPGWHISKSEKVDARNVRCCKETGHKPGGCTGAVATKFWTFRWEYYCQECREYEWGGSRNSRVYDRSIVGCFLRQRAESTPNVVDPS